MKKYIIPVIVALIVGVIIGYATHSSSPIVGGASSTSGTLQTTPIYAAETINTATVATTTGSFALLNSSSDRAIQSGFAYCTGVTAETQNSSWGFTAATSSTVTTTNTAYALNMTIATTSSNIYNSSTTIATSGTSLNGLQYLWPTNTYLVFSFNATNTAVCTVGVHFIPL